MFRRVFKTGRRVAWVMLGVVCVVGVGRTGAAAPGDRLSFVDAHSEGLTWSMVLPNLDSYKTTPVSAGHEHEVEGDIELFEHWRIMEDVMPVEAMLWASSHLYISIRRSNRPPLSVRSSSGREWATYDAGMLALHVQQRTQMVALASSKKSLTHQLMGAMAMGFLGELGENRKAANVLFNQGLTYDNPLVVVKSAIALLMGGSEKDRLRLARVFDRLSLEVQDRLVMALLTKSVRIGVRGLHLLPILEQYLRVETHLMATRADERHNPQMVDSAVRGMDLISFEEMLRGRPEWVLRLKVNRVEAIREVHQRVFGAFGDPPEPPPMDRIPDSDLLAPEINLVSSAMFVVLNTPKSDHGEPLFQVANRVVLNEIDRVTNLPSGWIRDYQFLYSMLQLIRRQDFLGVYEPLLTHPDPNIQAWASAAILMKNWEYDGFGPQEGAHLRAVAVFRELLASGFIPDKLRRPITSLHLLKQYLRRLDECSETPSP